MMALLGPPTDLITGIEWVVTYRSSPAVINLSYGDNGTAGSFAVRDALQRAVDYGSVVVLSAGNSNRDAYEWRPNRVSPAFVVAAAGWSSQGEYLYRRSDSNYGPTVDVFGPGNGTYAASHTSSTAFTSFAGTSAAAPFVAGAVAQILEAYPCLTPTEVEYWIKSNSTPDVVTGTVTGDPNLFLSRW